MTDYEDIYGTRAHAYHRLVMAEDVDGQLRPALERAAAGKLAGGRVVEVGAGTGRVTALLLDAGAADVLATEPSVAMRTRAAQHLASYDPHRFRMTAGDFAAIPAEDASADVVVAGWALGHQIGWHPDDWEARVDAGVAEMRRVAGPEGRVIVIETLGTGVRQPGPPNDGLAAYYKRLEERWELTREEIATDYQFSSPEEAAEGLGFFFGGRVVARILAEGWERVPEWTGVWSG